MTVNSAWLVEVNAGDAEVDPPTNGFLLIADEGTKKNSALSLRFLESLVFVERACLAPVFAVLANPVEQGALKADVFALLFRFNPFVA